MNIRRLKGEIIATYGTQNAFAGAMNWSINKVSRMMRGKYKPDTDEVAKIVGSLNLTAQKYYEIFLPSISPNGE